MSKIKRDAFLKMGALAILAPVCNSFFVQAIPANSVKSILFKDDLLNRLLVANDQQVTKLLQSANMEESNFGRMLGYDFAVLSAAYCSPQSKYHQSPVIVSKLLNITRLLINAQSKDGTVNIGNLESPPDTAFLLEPVTAGASLLAKNQSKDLNNVNSEIKKFILSSAAALRVGGVHTSNHRWVVCAALARVNALYPDKRWLTRIEDWLGEGIYMDRDGHFPERSRNYDVVETGSLITLARLLNKPSLLAPVRKNLEMTWFYMDPNGDLVTTDSRRQDQYASKNMVAFYLQYRHLAIKDNNRIFAGIVRQIRDMKAFEEEVLDRFFFHFLDNPLLQQELPVSTPPATDYEKLFTTSSLLRIRRGNTTTTLFGGADWPLIIASGRSNSPNFYSFRKGNAILKYMRLSTNFFSMGYFYSEGLQKINKTYRLHQGLAVPYYQPLPANRRKGNGDYKLSPSTDGRFWNKMDFENRRVSNLKNLEITVVFLETNGANELNIQVTGQQGVTVTIELCFLEGGVLSGVSQTPEGDSFLEKGMGKYEFGGDAILFGPGTFIHQPVKGLEGERYSTHFGSLRTPGMHVYLTGITPFNHKLTFS